MFSIIKEIFRFLVVYKKFWLMPLMIILLFFSVIIILTKGSAVAPFIYTIF